jgi:hypothetical protein
MNMLRFTFVKCKYRTYSMLLTILLVHYIQPHGVAFRRVSHLLPPVLLVGAISGFGEYVYGNILCRSFCSHPSTQQECLRTLW